MLVKACYESPLIPDYTAHKNVATLVPKSHWKRTSLRECHVKVNEKSQLQCTGPREGYSSYVCGRTSQDKVGYTMQELLRKQINECCQAIDAMKTGHRLEALLSRGVAEF